MMLIPPTEISIRRPCRAPGRITLLAMAVAVLLAAGCSTTQPPAPVPVKVPIPVECRVQTPAEPALPLAALVPPYTLDQWVAAAIAQDEILAGYILELQVALASCTAPVDPAAAPPGARTPADL